LRYGKMLIRDLLHRMRQDGSSSRQVHRHLLRMDLAGEGIPWLRTNHRKDFFVIFGL
jgi:hypothetical protein